MKKIFKKNQIIITALAVMIAAAGYLNYMQENQAVNTAGTDELTYIQEDVYDLSQEDLNLSETGEDSKKEGDKESSQTEDGTEQKEKNEDKKDSAAVDSSSDLTVTDTGDVVSEANEQVGEAVLVNNTINGDFFSSARLTREQTRAKNKEMLMEIVDNEKISEEQKKDAIAGVVKLTDIAEMESATEILLEAKGFGDSVVSIVDESADVIVNANDLTEQQIAQIEDIVKRKTGLAAENIVISPVGVAENKTEDE